MYEKTTQSFLSRMVGIRTRYYPIKSKYAHSIDKTTGIMSL